MAVADHDPEPSELSTCRIYDTAQWHDSDQVGFSATALNLAFNGAHDICNVRVDVTVYDATGDQRGHCRGGGGGSNIAQASCTAAVYTDGPYCATAIATAWAFYDYHYYPGGGYGWKEAETDRRVELVGDCRPGGSISVIDFVENRCKCSLIEVVEQFTRLMEG